jgi:hypothetical protein
MRKFHKRPSSPLDRLDDNAKLGAIEQAIEEAARMGLIVDSGERRWNERTGRYEIVWKSKVYERPNWGDEERCLAANGPVTSGPSAFTELP